MDDDILIELGLTEIERELVKIDPATARFRPRRGLIHFWLVTLTATSN